MEETRMNGNATALAQYETPFADVPVMRETVQQNLSVDNLLNDFFREVESPFSRTYEATPSNSLSPINEEYVDLLAELHDSEFNETLYEMANEVEDTWRNKVSNELAMGENFLPFATQQAHEYLNPVIMEAEAMIDRVTQHFSGNNLADHSEASVESFFETLEFGHSQYTPAQEQFFGKLLKKVKSVVGKGVAFAKKGAAVLGKLSPTHFVLRKIKKLVRPLLEKVLKFAINKLPKSLQGHAQNLAAKFLGIKPAAADTNNAAAAQTADNMAAAQAARAADAAGGDLDAVQSELDNHIAQLVFSDNEGDLDATVMNYEQSDETVERFNSYETGYINTPSLDVARQQFIDELKDLKDGESPAPAIERFLPVIIKALQPVLKIAIKLIGRQKVISFQAGLLAKLISKWVPANVAKPLAEKIIDVGMNAIGFEVHETNKADLAYEAIANTIQETVQNMTAMDEASLNDTEIVSVNLLEAFEQAAANNFPSQYIKEELRQTNQRAVWVAMPRSLPVKFYKKFTHIYTITIEPQTASTVTTYRSLPLANFLKDKYGLDTTKPINAKVHLFETSMGGRLSMISKFEKLPGLNARQPKAWIQLLPLTVQAASLLLKEARLGRDVPAKNLSTRFKASPGQRFYYLEIEGARLLIPQVNRSKHKHSENGQPASATESRSADIQGVINFIRSEIKLNYYFSEEDAKEVVEKSNKGDFLGAAMSIRQSVKKVLNDILVKNVATKVKIVHEAIPAMFLEREDPVPAGELGKVAGNALVSNLIQKLIDKIADDAYEAVVKFFKERANQFKEAQAQPQDGVTIKLIWNNVAGRSTLRKVIGAIKGDQPIGNLSDLALPNLPAPEIKIAADKQFD